VRDSDEIVIEPLKRVGVCISNTNPDDVVLHLESTNGGNFFFATTRQGLAILSDRLAIDAATPTPRVAQ
jgi:hypothetical protein